MSLLVVYLMTNWMPTLLQQASGASLADAAVIGAMYQVGGTLGAILVGRLMDRFEPHRVLFAGYLTGAACIVLISLSTDRRWLMTLAVFAAGACISAARLAATRSRRRSTRPRLARPASLGRTASAAAGRLSGRCWAASCSASDGRRQRSMPSVAIPAVISALALATLGLVRRREAIARFAIAR